ncbi:hypothetical protein [Saccharothrix coeruleofusca]|uniref:Uncharacterized protein n=1 Tax=Saccharothrix coeruleofusca TaxID=33919 RepID=A0A918EG67_9PSEU|nr:hypothetical protein [Saccharothrix coeruleofusca]MBP2336674.1 hypothetical protein [Saccharothrix coeruleofusca]GGP78810.1 hypothetical protein GCM10010185_60820 [Saccharothrix coeruleofusca]
MKRLGWLIVVALLAGLPAPGTASAAARSPADCAAALDCTAAEIDRMAMDERLELLRALQRGPAAVFGATDRWRNVEGVIAFFRDRGLGAPGTWVSHVDAGILEGIERGVAIALGRSTDGFGNPGSAEWADYLIALRRGELAERAAHDRAWSEAEQAATDHGVVLAERVRGLRPTAVERRFFLFSEFYRWTLRNRPAVLDLLLVHGVLVHPVLPLRRVPFVDWFTDVGNPVPSYEGCQVAYAHAELDPVSGSFGTLELLLAYLPELFEEFRGDRAGG